MEKLVANATLTAQRRDDKAFMLVAKQLRGLLTVFEGKLQDAGLSATEKLWMQFSLHGPAHRPTCSWGSAMMVLEIARRPSRLTNAHEVLFSRQRCNADTVWAFLRQG